MTSTGFYADPAEPTFGEQMDPLGTAAQAERAAEKPAPSPSVTIGKTKVKNKMSTGKKVALGAGGLLLAFLALVFALDSTQPNVNASPNPQVAMPALANPGQVMSADTADSATVMGGAPAPAAASPATPEVADQATAAVIGAAPAPAPAAPAPAAPAPAAPTPAAPTPAAPAVASAPAAAPAAATTPPATPAATPAAPATAPTAAPAVAAQAAQTSETAKLDGKAHVTAKADMPSVTPEQLASRVSVLERRLARYERAEAQERARSAKEVAVRAKPAVAVKVQPVAQSIAETKKPVALDADTVRVIGVSTHHGVTTALVDFGGVKSRVAQGQSIPGLGTVQSVAVDAAGNPVVEINGVSYR